MKFGTKMHLGTENSNWLGAIRKLMSELFQGAFSFSVHMFACKNEDVIICHISIWTTRKQEELDISKFRRAYL